MIGGSGRPAPVPLGPHHFETQAVGEGLHQRRRGKLLDVTEWAMWGQAPYFELGVVGQSKPVAESG